MPRALILGGSGAVGRATALTLLSAGWEVDLTGRNPLRFDPDVVAMGARYIRSDRRDMNELTDVFGDGTDLLVDCACYTAKEANQLVELARNVTATVMVSSKAVYVDSNGKHSNSPDGPQFDRPIRETQATIEPKVLDFTSAEGYGANKAAAERELLDSGLPISILRPSKIHGVGAKRPREWFFVKRILDRRPLLLSNQGKSVESPTASVNLAALILVISANPGRRILNVADPDAPDVKTMAELIASHLNYDWPELLLLTDAPVGIGRSPWDNSSPVIVDTTAALELGYRPVGDYSSTVCDEIDWLVKIASDNHGHVLPPEFDNSFFDGLFDYEKEDAYLADARGRR